MRSSIALACLLAACAAPSRKPPPPSDAGVRSGAFEAGKVRTATVEDPVVRPRGVVLAVLPLRNNTPDKGLDGAGESLADLLSATLARDGRLQLVERQRLDALVDEIYRGDSGPIDTATAARYGRMLGANLMAFGSFGKIGARHVVTLRVVKVETSEIVGGATEYLDGLDELGPHAQALSAKLIAEIAGAR